MVSNLKLPFKNLCLRLIFNTYPSYLGLVPINNPKLDICNLGF